MSIISTLLNIHTLTIEEKIDGLKAWLQKEPCQIWTSSGWADFSHSMDGPDTYLSISRGTNIRRKPQPKLRPWKPGEVPLGAWFRHDGTPQSVQIIVAVMDVGFRNFCNFYSFDSVLAGDYSYSADAGKTWLPCGILE
jgi:hypothetical protein